MRHLVFALPMVGVLTGGALAAPPTAEQKATFYETCLVRGSEELCTCKADAAMTLVDSDFIAVVIASMQDKPLHDDEHAVRYNEYIRASNAICIPGY